MARNGHSWVPTHGSLRELAPFGRAGAYGAAVPFGDWLPSVAQAPFGRRRPLQGPGSLRSRLYGEVFDESTIEPSRLRRGAFGAEPSALEWNLTGFPSPEKRYSVTGSSKGSML